MDPIYQDDIGVIAGLSCWDSSEIPFCSGPGPGPGPGGECSPVAPDDWCGPCSPNVTGR